MKQKRFRKDRCRFDIGLMGGIERFTCTIAHGRLAGQPVDESAGAAGPIALRFASRTRWSDFLSNVFARTAG
jgi:hypothetical protein